MSKIDSSILRVRKKKSKNVTPQSKWRMPMRDLFCTLNEVPWTVVGAVSAISGFLLLVSYTEPFYGLLADPGVLFTFGWLASLVSCVAIFGLMLGFFGPALFCSGYNKTKGGKAFPITAPALYLFQIAYLAIFTTYTYWRAGFSCLTEDFLLFWLGGVGPLTLALGRLGYGAYKIHKAGATSDGFVLVGAALISCLYAALPLVIKNLSDWVFYGLLVLMPLVNALLVGMRRISVLVVSAIALVVLSVLWLSILTNGQQGLPVLVARLMHVNSVKTQQIIVKPEACQNLYATVIASGLETPPFDCNSKPSAINATVAWNIGPRWIVEFEKESSTTSKKKIYAVVPTDAVLGMP